VSEERFVVALDRGRLSFARGGSAGPDRVVAYEFAGDGACVIAAARARGLPATADSVTIAGTVLRIAA
jgi:hypothetical protein